MGAHIVVIGSSNTDMVVRVPRIPQPGETVLGGEFTMAAGGKGANQAVAAARAGGRVRFVARVGDDMFGGRALQGFGRDDIDVTHVRRDEGETSGVALIFVAADGQNSIAVAPGANGRLSPEDVREARRAIVSATVVVMSLETPIETVSAAAQIASSAGVPVILNPAPARELDAELLQRVSILTPNESEATLLTGVRVEGEDGAEYAARSLLSRGVDTVLITLGASGTFVASGEICERIPGYRVEPVDSTAAGDVFNGSLAVALAEKQPLMDAVRFANAAAALSVTRMGAQPSAPSRAEIQAFMARLS